MESPEIYGSENSDEEYERRVSIDVQKSLSKTLVLGDSVTATISGEVCGISHDYGDKGDAKTIRLEIRFSKPPKIVTNRADASIRAMMGNQNKVGRTKNEADMSLDDLHDGVERSY